MSALQLNCTLLCRSFVHPNYALHIYCTNEFCSGNGGLDLELSAKRIQRLTLFYSKSLLKSDSFVSFNCIDDRERKVSKQKLRTQLSITENHRCKSDRSDWSWQLAT
jgi:hypothetical protein